MPAKQADDSCYGKRRIETVENCDCGKAATEDSSTDHQLHQIRLIHRVLHTTKPADIITGTDNHGRRSHPATDKPSYFDKPMTSISILTRVSIHCLIFTSPIFAADWNQYRGSQADGKSEEVISVDGFLNGMAKPVWKTPTPNGFSSFSVKDQTVVTVVTRASKEGNKETCIALDAKTGKELWSAPLSSSDYGHGGGDAGAPGNRGGDGPRNTPTIADNHVYVYDGHLVLTCLDLKDGSRVWEHDMVKEFNGRNIKWFNATSPVIDGDSIFVSGGGPGESFLCFEKNSGKLLWKTGDATMTHATPAFAEFAGQTQVIFFMQSGLVSLDSKTGEEKWQSQFPFSVSTAASPVTFDNEVYCSAGYGVGAGLFRFGKQQEAEEVWFKPNELMNHWSTPVIKDGYLYGIYEFKKYGRAPLQCVELATGEIKWSQPGFGPGNVIMVGDHLVALSDAGEVALARATPDSYQELGRSKAITGKCWSTPAFSDGKLYVRSTIAGACFDLSAP